MDHIIKIQKISMKLHIPLSQMGCIFDSISAERSDLPTNKCPGYVSKPSDDETSVLEFWGMWSAPSIPLFSDPLGPGVVVPVISLMLNRTV